MPLKNIFNFFVRKGSVLQKEAFVFVLFTFFGVSFLFLLDFEVPF